MIEVEKRIYYHDTDAGGVVYYANYLKYFEEARTEFLRGKGIDVRELAKSGTLFVIRRVEIDYKSPARYGNIIKVTAEISKVKNVSLEFSQCVKRKDQILVCAKIQLVCINTSFQPKALPANIIQRL
ncbi:MAG: tol-pal system-associated acyl-CoA thioesterase [Omnitrophica bacterium]|nr:tol-pal system-associated acyl-CoA thioesterase [Candidatus Omnitrophota bacterium]